MLAEVLFGADPLDSATVPTPPPRLLATASSPPPVRPTLAMLRRLPGGDLHDDMAGAMDELLAALGADAFEVELPPAFADAASHRQTINLAEMAKAYYSYERKGRERLSPVLCEALDRGKAMLARDYLAALDWPHILNAGLGEILSRCDALICPAALGPAPADRTTTGDPICNGLWSLCGVPAITLPLLQASDGMPMGLQVIGQRGDDARLLRTANWLWTRVRTMEGDPT